MLKVPLQPPEKDSMTRGSAQSSDGPTDTNGKRKSPPAGKLGGHRDTIESLASLLRAREGIEIPGSSCIPRDGDYGTTPHILRGVSRSRAPRWGSKIRGEPGGR